jgi:chaperonin cofactor prefoldin
MSDLKKIVNGKVMNLTDEEIADFETRKQKIETEYAELNEAKQNRENLKASAKAKLITGEPLTEEEADTVVL